jgi:hypothetical protein
MTEIAEIMGAVTNCAVAGIQAGRDLGKAERDRLQSQLDEAVRLMRDMLPRLFGHSHMHCGPDNICDSCVLRQQVKQFLAAREDAA